MSAPTLPETEPKSHRQVLEALSGLLLVLFVAMVSSTIVSIALPQIIGSLNGTQSQYTWVVTAALLTTTASTPIWGKLADLFDKKLLIEIAIGIFLVASLACGFAQNTPMLIAFRAVQGLGMGALQILVQVVIAAIIPPKERGKYNGYLGGVLAVATVGGPLLGGVITDTSWLGWRWCFFLPIPFTLIALVVLHRTLNVMSVRRPETSVDYPGAILIAAGVSLLLIWVTFVGNSFDWISWQTLAMVGVSIVLLVAATWVESVVKEPVVPLHVVRRPTPALAILVSVAVGMAMFGGAVFLGQYFQIGRGYSPTESGLLTIPMMFGTLVSSTISGQLVSRSGRTRPYIIAGSIVLTLGFLIMSTIDHETSMVIVGLGMLVIGVGVGMCMQNLVLAVQNTVPLREVGAATGAITFFRSLGGTIGVSVLGAVLANRVTADITEGFAKAGIRPSGSQDGSTLNMAAMPEPIRVIVRAAYGDATGHIFLVSAGIAVVGIVAALFLKPARLRESVDLVEPAPPAEARR